MKKLLVLVLTLVTVFGMTVPTGAVNPEETIYLVTNDSNITSVTAAFFNLEVSQDPESYAMTPLGGGVFAVTVPNDATSFYFVSENRPGEILNDHRIDLSACTGNTYNMASKTWYTTTNGIDGALETNSDTEEATETSPNSANLDAETSSATINVSGTVGNAEPVEEVISVNISWGAMEFIYTPTGTGTWDPNTHTYGDGAEAGWTPGDGSNSITVTNHSNVDITAEFDFDAAIEQIEGQFRDENGGAITDISLDSADQQLDQSGAGVPTTQTVTFHITEGDISEATDSLGTITVTISKATD